MKYLSQITKQTIDCIFELTIYSFISMSEFLIWIINLFISMLKEFLLIYSKFQKWKVSIPLGSLKSGIIMEW